MIDPLNVTTEELLQIKDRMRLLDKIKRGKVYALSRVEFIQRQFRMVDAKKRHRLAKEQREWLDVLKHIEELPSI